MKAINKVSDLLDRICGVLIVFMIGAMVILTTAQIIFRTWFTSLSWSEEVTRYLLIWSTFLGATCVYRHAGNIAITFVQDLLPGKARKVMQILVQVICLVLFALLCYYGTRYAMNLKKTATSIPVRMSYIFMVVPISMGICIIHAVALLLNEICGPSRPGTDAAADRVPDTAAGAGEDAAPATAGGPAADTAAGRVSEAAAGAAGREEVTRP